MRGGPAQGHPGVRANRAGPQLPSSLALPQSPRGQFEGALETRRFGSLEGSTGGLGPSPSCTMDMLCDLGQVVTLSSPVSVQGRGPVILARVPLSLPHPLAMDGPESAQPGLSLPVRATRVGVPSLFPEYSAGLVGSGAPGVRQGALPHCARLPVRLPKDSVDAAGGAGAVAG